MTVHSVSRSAGPSEQHPWFGSTTPENRPSNFPVSWPGTVRSCRQTDRHQTGLPFLLITSRQSTRDLVSPVERDRRLSHPIVPPRAANRDIQTVVRLPGGCHRRKERISISAPAGPRSPCQLAVLSCSVKDDSPDLLSSPFVSITKPQR